MPLRAEPPLAAAAAAVTAVASAASAAVAAAAAHAAAALALAAAALAAAALAAATPTATMLSLLLGGRRRGHGRGLRPRGAWCGARSVLEAERGGRRSERGHPLGHEARREQGGLQRGLDLLARRRCLAR